MANICEGVPEFPLFAESSNRYRELFNKTAAELGIKIEFTGDVLGGLPNVPEGGEIKITDPSVLRKYGITEHQPKELNPLLAADICTIRSVMHKRIKRMNEEGPKLFPILASKTLKDNKLDEAGPAVSAWAKAVLPAIFDSVQNIYGLQRYSRSEEALQWLKGSVDENALYNFHKGRDNLFNTNDVTDFPNAKDYVCALPWCPDSPTFSLMWPSDMTQEELNYITEHYDQFDPIRATYTVVRRITDKDAEEIRKNPKTVGERPVEWVREGKDGRLYHVLNMAFDENMRPHFLKIAEVLEANAAISVEGKVLDEEFKQWTMTIAKCLRDGDFEALLKADLEQYKSPLFFTIFPHEGYWDDGIKYPILAEFGIKADLGELEKQSYAFELLRDRVTRVAREQGLENFTAPAFDVNNIKKSAILFWPGMTAGFMRTFRRDPGGHDYPRIPYKGIDGHRIIMLLDTLAEWAPLTREVAQNFFGDRVAGHITDRSIIGTAIGHEATHAVQIQPTAVTLSGKTLSSAFGKWWGVLVEPWADTGDVLFNNKLYTDGKIGKDEYYELVYGDVVYNVVRMMSRDDVLSEENVGDIPHVTGSNMYIGRLYAGGALTYKDGRFTLNEQLAIKVTGEFFDELTAHAARGDLEAFKAFARKCVESIPLEVEKEILAGKKSPYVVLYRGELKLPRHHMELLKLRK
jgi:hypothetical protein